MKREIHLGSKRNAPQLWGYSGEKEHSQITVTLPSDVADCDYAQAEIAIRGVLYRSDRLEIENGTVTFTLSAGIKKQSGPVALQIIGYVVDESGNINEIAKTPVYKGTIQKSVEGAENTAPEEDPLWLRTWIKVNAVADIAHTHSNKSVIDKLTEGADGKLKYGDAEIGSGGIQSVTEFPATAKEGDVVLLHRCNEITPDDSNSGVILDIPAIVSLGVPEGYYRRQWDITATNSKGVGLEIAIEIQPVDDYILTGLMVVSETFAGRWYWKNGEFTTDIYGGEAEPPQFTYIPLGYVDSFTFTKTLYDLDYWDTPDPDETVIFRTLPLHYMFFNGEWQLVSPNNNALQRAVEELQRNVGKYAPMTKVETTTTGTSILEPNKMYDYGVVDILTVVFDEGKDDKVNEYLFSFISGETATVLTLPSTVKWVNELTVEANKRYEVSVVDNVALWCAVEVSV